MIICKDDTYKYIFLYTGILYSLVFNEMFVNIDRLYFELLLLIVLSSWSHFMADLKNMAFKWIPIFLFFFAAALYILLTIPQQLALHVLGILYLIHLVMTPITYQQTISIYVQRTIIFIMLVTTYVINSQLYVDELEAFNNSLSNVIPVSDWHQMIIQRDAINMVVVICLFIHTTVTLITLSFTFFAIGSVLIVMSFLLPPWHLYNAIFLFIHFPMELHRIFQKGVNIDYKFIYISLNVVVGILFGLYYKDAFLDTVNFYKGIHVILSFLIAEELYFTLNR